ncbi:MAG: DNA/RNA nuclease SfsA [Planctomycetes bacterium]|nr:DNA/RNA nuclease SfsA [Planctomycetota bacterium]
MTSFTLIEGRLLRRYKRFLADCELPEHGLVTAHCPNPGSMKTLVDGEPVAWLRHVPAPNRKLPWTLTLIEVRRGRKALVDTSLPNQIVADGILAGKVASLGDFEQLHREVPIGQGTRLDIVLGGQQRPNEATGQIFIEVKNVTMLSCFDRDRADFPDSVTERGRKHLEVLTRLSESGKRAILFLLLGRTDCNKVGFAQEIDPAYCEALRVAVSAGVEVISHRVRVRSGNLTLGESVPIKLPGRAETS